MPFISTNTKNMIFATFIIIIPLLNGEAYIGIGISVILFVRLFVKKKKENSCETAGQISESNQNMSQLFSIQLANWLSGPLAQWLACSPCTQQHVGSNPTPATHSNVLMIGRVCRSSSTGEQISNLEWALYK